jgi:hypothetical protein
MSSLDKYTPMEILSITTYNTTIKIIQLCEMDGGTLVTQHCNRKEQNILEIRSNDHGYD